MSHFMDPWNEVGTDRYRDMQTWTLLDNCESNQNKQDFFTLFTVYCTAQTLFFCLFFNYDLFLLSTRALLHTFWQNIMGILCEPKVIGPDLTHTFKKIVIFGQISIKWKSLYFYFWYQICLNTHSNNTN